MHLDEVLAEDLLPREAGDLDRLVVPLVHESAKTEVRQLQQQ